MALSLTEQTAATYIKIFPGEISSDDVPELKDSEDPILSFVRMLVGACFQGSTYTKRNHKGMDNHFFDCLDLRRNWSELVVEVYDYAYDLPECLVIQIYVTVDTPFLTWEEQEENDRYVLDYLYRKTQQACHWCLDKLPGKVFVVETGGWQTLTPIRTKDDPFPPNQLRL